MSAVPNTPAANDPDSLETQEWLDALEAVIDRETGRSLLASFLISGAMMASILVVAWVLPIGTTGWIGAALDLMRDVAVGGAVYIGAAAATHRPELRWLLERRTVA